MKLKAVPGRVIAKIENPIDQDIKTESGLFLGKREVKDVTYWKACVTDSNDNSIKNGDFILFGKHAGSTLVDDYVSVSISDILGII